MRKHVLVFFLAILWVGFVVGLLDSSEKVPATVWSRRRVASVAAVLYLGTTYLSFRVLDRLERTDSLRRRLKYWLVFIFLSCLILAAWGIMWSFLR